MEKAICRTAILVRVPHADLSLAAGAILVAFGFGVGIEATCVRVSPAVPHRCTAPHLVAAARMATEWCTEEWQICVMLEGHTVLHTVERESKS